MCDSVYSRHADVVTLPVFTVPPWHRVSVYCRAVLAYTDMARSVRPSVSWTFGQLPLAGIRNKAAKNICIQVCVGMFSQVNILGMELVGHTITCQLFKNCFPKSSCTILPSPLAVYEDSDFSTSLPIFFLTYTSFFYLLILERKTSICFSTYLCTLIGWFFYVLWPGIEPPQPWGIKMLL